MSLFSAPVGSSFSSWFANVHSMVLGSIPSPTRGTISIGPLKFNAYGLCIALGAIAAVSFASRRWQRSGGNADDVAAISMFAVPAGVIGARLYHLATDWKSYRGHWVDALRIWDGGLGIWGGIALGTLVGLYVGRKRGCSMPGLLDAAAPALPLAQAIGRWGNWFNVELFGGPTKLPWGLEIPLAKRPSAYKDFSTFHPTFLYESLWNLSVVALVLFVERRWGKRLPKGRLFTVYVSGYTFGRFWIERIRTDHAYKILGLRINEWTSSILFVTAIVVLVVSVVRARAVDTLTFDTLTFDTLVSDTLTSDTLVSDTLVSDPPVADAPVADS